MLPCTFFLVSLLLLHVGLLCKHTQCGKRWLSNMLTLLKLCLAECTWVIRPSELAFLNIFFPNKRNDSEIDALRLLSPVHQWRLWSIQGPSRKSGWKTLFLCTNIQHTLPHWVQTFVHRMPASAVPLPPHTPSFDTGNPAYSKWVAMAPIMGQEREQGVVVEAMKGKGRGGCAPSISWQLLHLSNYPVAVVTTQKQVRQDTCNSYF